MQILCRVIFSGLAKGLALVLLAVAVQAAPNAISPQAAPSKPTPVAPVAELSPRQFMLDQAVAWLSQSQGRAANSIQFAPLDERVMVRPCAGPLQFDMPFASRETVRVRCMGTAAAGQAPGQAAPQAASSWQLYLRWVNAASSAAGDVRPDPRADNRTAPTLRKVLMAKQQLQRGTRLSPEMFEVVEMAVPNWTPAMLDSTKEVAQMELVRDIPAGALLQGFDAKKAILVKQGQMAMLTLGEGKGFKISVKVEALQDGRLGEQIRLKNAESGKILSGVVSGASAVRGI
jgi:flagella basal body P-ring formation protein FlgA